MSAPLPQLAVDVVDVHKSYPKTRRWREMLRAPQTAERIEALRGVSLSVPSGTVHGLLGANGAGKTTLLKVLSTLVAPSAGRARVAGFDVGTEAEQVRRRLGYVTAQERSFFWRLTGRQNLLFFAALHDLRGSRAEREVDGLLETVGLTGESRRPFREYSSGMMQKLAIARGLLGEPEVVLMDEPTSSLDPPSTAWVQRFTRETLVGERGATVLLATHDLLEAETTCDTLSLVDEGRIVADGPVSRLKRPLGRAARCEIVLLDPPAELLERLDPQRVELRPAEPRASGRRTLVGPGGEAERAALVSELAAAGARIVEVRPEEASLSVLFRRVDGGQGER
jgi:ABC-2 type transport system ATP-binding protein